MAPTRVQRTCTLCEKAFLALAAEVKRGHAQYCSKLCGNRHKALMMPRQTPIERFMDKFIPEPNSGCWLWTASCDEHGYGQFMYKGKCKKASRIAYEFLVAPVPKGLCVRHACDNPYCVNPDHLTLGSHQENMLDKCKRGRDSRTDQKRRRNMRERNKHLLMTKEVIQEIKDLAATGLTPKEIAKHFFISITMAYKIIDGRLEAPTMTIDLVNMDTFPPEIWGPFATPREADSAAENSRLTSYALWENGVRLKVVGRSATTLQSGLVVDCAERSRIIEDTD